MPASQCSAVAIRRVALETNALLATIVDRAGCAVSCCGASVSDWACKSIVKAEPLIVFGGPIGAYDHNTNPLPADEIKFLQCWLKRGPPTRGIRHAHLLTWGFGGYRGSRRPSSTVRLAHGRFQRRLAPASVHATMGVVH